ncbi:flap endonuclease-1 [Candidatus Woesearchaeota archaeon]|nr:flap endonuclease-1 [Candidatus Woesearchaeota archaeon]
MGVAITQLLEGQEISIEDLKGKVLAVDAFNMLYQFVTTIRMRDGTPLKDSKGNITSHLIGLFSRTTSLMAQGLKLVFVFDGKAPELKKQERERRAKVKAEALQKFKEAEDAEDVEGMQKYAGRAAKLTTEMIQEAKDLLAALGVPVVQAPSEGEAQCAHMVKQGDAYAVVSQDADSFLFGATRVVRNLNLSGRRKKTNALAYETIKPELYTLDTTLKTLELTNEQLIILAILVGTDYNREGIKGIGPKKAKKLLDEHGTNYDALFAAVEWKTHYDLDWKVLRDAFTKMPMIDDYELQWNAPNEAALRKLLVEDHDFSEERITTALKKLQESDAAKQKGLGEFL